MLPASYSVAGEHKKLLDWFMFSYLLLIPLTRQVPYHQVISYGGTAMLLIVYMARKLLYGSDLRFPPPLVILTVVFYLFTVFISSLFSNYMIDGTRQLVREIFFFLILFVIYDYIRSLRQWYNIVHALMWCGGITVISVLVAGLLAFLAGEPLLGGATRVGGVFSNPNVAGHLISVCFPVALGYLQWKKHTGSGSSMGILIVLLSLTTFAAAILTVSRGLLMGFSFSLIALHIEEIWKYRYKLLIVFIGLSFAAVVVGMTMMNAELVDLLTTSLRLDRGLAGRGFIWGRAWSIFQENPIFGTGPGTFLYYILSPEELRQWGTVESIRFMYFQQGDRSLMGVPGIFSGVISNSAHNLWLDTAANTGIVGVVAVVLIFVVFAVVNIDRLHRFRADRQKPYYWVIRGCYVGLIAFFLRSQFEVSGILRGALSECLPFWLTFLLVISAPYTVRICSDKKRVNGNE